MPKIDIEEDWGFKVDGTCETPYEAKEYVQKALLWLCEEHHISQAEVFNTKADKSLMVRDLWHFIALEALRPWMDKIEISRFVNCHSHSTFYESWKRQERRHKQEQVL
jgi:hypothetical protein